MHIAMADKYHPDFLAHCLLLLAMDIYKVLGDILNNLGIHIHNIRHAKSVKSKTSALYGLKDEHKKRGNPTIFEFATKQHKTFKSVSKHGEKGGPRRPTKSTKCSNDVGRRGGKKSI